MSPELPTFSAELAAKHKLTFPVLNDHGLTIAKAFGLVFTLPDDLKDVYLNVFKNDLAKRNGEPSWQLPMPARFVIDRNAIIRAAEPIPITRSDPSPRKPSPSSRCLPEISEHDAGPIRPSQQRIASGAEPIRQSR